MTEGTKTQTKRETTAREWLVLIAIGVAMAIVGASSDYTNALPIGLLIVLVGLFGMGWRLLGNR